MVRLKPMRIARCFLSSLVGAFFFGTLVLPCTAHAKTVSKYGAELLLSGGAELHLALGETINYRVAFKNIGNITWRETDKTFASIYTYEPKYRKSVFATNTWLDSGHPVRYQGTDVKPGNVAFFTIPLKAPKTPGVYREAFNLAAEDVTWMPGGRFAVIIHVSDKGTGARSTGTIEALPPTTTGAPLALELDALDRAPSVTAISKYRAAVLLKSANKVSAHAGEIISYVVGVKNNGDQVWPNYAIRSDRIAIAAILALSDLRAPEWTASTTAVEYPSSSVSPGALAMIPFTFRAPPSRGDYTVSFHIYASGEPVEGGMIDIPVTVTDDANALAPPPLALLGVEGSSAPAVALISEPILRIGLFKTLSGETITSDRSYTIQDMSGAVLLTLPGGAVASLSYAGGVYKALTDRATLATSLTPLRVVPLDGADAIFTIASHENRPTWNLKLNDNQFRGVLEIRYSTANDTVWMINELPIEKYLRGLAETGNNSPLEYRKALHTAARSYAYYHYLAKKKHKDRGFDIDAKYDQVYRGYGAEKRGPGIVAAVEATRGVVVRYQGEPALTPYYANSDGRTRSYQEVWGGKGRPYLVSMPAPYDTGKTLWGHGVGMSATDAAGHADKEGWDFERLLKYYYQGVEMIRQWE